MFRRTIVRLSHTCLFFFVRSFPVHESIPPIIPAIPCFLASLFNRAMEKAALFPPSWWRIKSPWLINLRIPKLPNFGKENKADDQPSNQIKSDQTLNRHTTSPAKGFMQELYRKTSEPPGRLFRSRWHLLDMYVTKATFWNLLANEHKT